MAQQVKTLVAKLENKFDPGTYIEEGENRLL